MHQAMKTLKMMLVQGYNHFHLQFQELRLGLRMPLYLGLVSTVLNVAIFFYMSMLTWSVRRFDEKWELLSINALPFLTLLGLISFCLLCFALWPIWGFLTLPLLFTLFMAGVVVYPHIMIETLRQQNDSFRID
ncbi:hypothetical protein ERO13_D08G259900v2 [Gossypium hirsutum]|uniref:Uncharacterized protein n=3 Tax=Gossypium TaxID=3633 RepID=A0A5J5QRH0_GOSBA|nr:hypothetical protein ES319_D08G286500v1 [Gossypium barbadense]KAG4136130.1 hypothetical protein ERO13_D08G259900v2 [Gossypium hirsutum]TYG59394.1 hypothetical protein ES288_D08G298700v1 [Gossypium darwinii]TYI71365.1 hypothetical protein E1A91_D08G289500v1 [Gossypium mustelinum]